MIPDASNFYGSLQTSKSAWEVAELFEAAGWAVRKPDDRDHLEVRCAWAELVVEAASPVLVHGPVADVEDHAERILAVLERAGLDFVAECYGPGGELLRQWTRGDAEPGAPSGPSSEV